MSKDDLITEVVSENGDHIGIDLITLEDLKIYCKSNHLNLLDSTNIEKIVEDLLKQAEAEYEGSEDQEMDEMIEDLVNGDFDSRVGMARHVVRELYRSNDMIDNLMKENAKLKKQIK
jgi:hypothetical protein